MTTSIRVEARAHGATVVLRNSSSSDKFTIEPNTEQTFHIDEGYTLSVEQGPVPVPVEALFKEEEAKKADPFDHDGDGKPGGSKPRK